MIKMQRLTPERLGGILEAEPKAAAIFDGDMRVIGIELPLPEGVVYSDGSTTRTAMLGDRVGRDQYGHWLVFPAAPSVDRPQDTNGWPGGEHAEPGTRGWTA